LHQSWDFDDFFDKDGIWKPPKGHPAWHRVKSHTRKIQTVKHPKRVTLSKWDGNPITFPDKMSEVRNALTDVGLGYLVDKTFLKYWTTYGNKNLLIQARVQQWPITDWSQFSVDLEVFHGMLHQVFGYETTTKYLFSEDVAKHGVKTYLALQDLNAISYDLRRDYFLDMAREPYDPKEALSFTDFLKNKLHAHAELAHLGHEFSEDEKVSMLVQSIVNHRQNLQLMLKIDIERNKGADFQLIVNRIIKDFERLSFNRHSSQIQDRLANQATTIDDFSDTDPRDTDSDHDEGHSVHINQTNCGETQPKRPKDEYYLSSDQYENADADLIKKYRKMRDELKRLQLQSKSSKSSSGPSGSGVSFTMKDPNAPPQNGCSQNPSKSDSGKLPTQYTSDTKGGRKVQQAIAMHDSSEDEDDGSIKEVHEHEFDMSLEQARKAQPRFINMTRLDRGAVSTVGHPNGVTVKVTNRIFDRVVKSSKLDHDAPVYLTTCDGTADTWVVGKGWRIVWTDPTQTVNIVGFEESYAKKKGLHFVSADAVFFDQQGSPVILCVHCAVHNPTSNGTLMSEPQT
jgi:hypothetical protein